MSVTKFNAMLTGLLQMGSSYEWVITKKAGRSSEAHTLAAAAAAASKINELELNKLKKYDEEGKPRVQVKKADKMYEKELAFALLFLTAAGRCLLSGGGIHFCVLIVQGVSFLLVSLGQIGE